MSEFVKQNGFQLVLNRVVMRNLSWEKSESCFREEDPVTVITKVTPKLMRKVVQKWFQK